MRIVRTKRYQKDLKRMGASASDIATLEHAIALDPTVGDVIPGVGSRGKRGGGRAIYFLMVSDDTAIMLFAYAKSKQEDLTKEQRRTALEIMKELTGDQGIHFRRSPP